LDDRSARIEVTVFPDTFESVKDYLTPDQIVVVEGEVSIDEFRGGQKVVARNVLDIAKARIRYVEALRIDWCGQELATPQVQHLASLLTPYRGDGCDVVISVDSPQAKGDMRLGSQWKVMPDDELIHQLRATYGKQNVQLVYT
jgi:DNA polymerase-3 subunit alpha